MWLLWVPLLLEGPPGSEKPSTAAPCVARVRPCGVGGCVYPHTQKTASRAQEKAGTAISAVLALCRVLI